MTGILVAVLLGMSAVLLLPRSRSPVAQKRFRHPGFRSRLFAGRSASLVQELPLVIHQLTGLLAAGRAPHQLWADAAALQLTALQSSSKVLSGAASSGTAQDRRVPSGIVSSGTMPPRQGQPVAGPATGITLPEKLLPVLEAAAQASSLGLSPVPVFLAAAEPAAAAGGRSGRAPRNTRGLRDAGRSADIALGRLWAELAACVSVSERSGAPLAGVLDRYAAQLESGLDNQAARDTALAGPLATVRLLTWLPVGGLGLGYLLGADPVGILLGTPLGWLAAAAGITLSLIGRRWSTALVRSAAAS